MNGTHLYGPSMEKGVIRIAINKSAINVFLLEAIAVLGQAPQCFPRDRLSILHRASRPIAQEKLSGPEAAFQRVWRVFQREISWK